MDDKYIVLIGILIPFIGTTIGSGTVLFCKKEVNIVIQKLFFGFAAGVMIAASIWSLIIPAMEMTGGNVNISWIPACIGIILGVMLMILLDKFIKTLNNDEWNNDIDNRNKILNLAITLHNIPEGMAIGVAFASAINLESNIAFLSAFSIAVGIAIQNIPEGMAISLPLRTGGMSRLNAFGKGTLSGIVEPIASIVTIAISGLIESIMPILLALAAGSMLYVVIKELIPECQEGKYSNIRVNRCNNWFFDNDDFRCYIGINILF